MYRSTDDSNKYDALELLGGSTVNRTPF